MVRVFSSVSLVFFMLAVAAASSEKGDTHSPTFYKDILPILQQHCQMCHRRGEIAPMPLVNYLETKKYAAAMKRMTTSKMMPPWFADPRFGKFSNDLSLSAQEIASFAAWADAGAPPGNPKDAPPLRMWPLGWNIPPP